MKLLLWKTLLDLKHPAILWRLLLPFLIAMALVSLLGYSFLALFLTGDWITQNAYVVEFNETATQAEQWVAGIPLVGGLLVWTIMMMFTLLVGAVSFLLGSYLVLLLAILITSFMTDSLIKAVRDIHYPNVEYQGHGSFFGLSMKMLGYGAFLLLLLLLGVPLLFIPLVNIIWLWFLGFLFFRYALLLDVGQVVLSDQEFQQVSSLTQITPTLGLMLIYSATILPLVSFFAPVIGVIFLAHWTLRFRAA
ncbi:MAG TPA: EI24 domain-containing protein [Marinospirillum sp.]|uniref:EI24 domain-containing protein n=1 Tax=Marinospirillum sp. TaxID=2183934 RepID=UPI002B49C41B|nr:EI24 domain-containing protein [Marinospirillum sp.]HKM15696.1 EI24 domain-containing protein [Marinospirillum sp.]